MEMTHSDRMKRLITAVATTIQNSWERILTG